MRYNVNELSGAKDMNNSNIGVQSIGFGFR